MNTPTKTLKFDTDVQDILSSMRIEQENGSYTGFLTCGQLERDMYTRVNKALEALGGKWNRKAGRHVFESDPRLQWASVVENGTITVEQDGFFETPRAITLQMLDIAPLTRHTLLILEPSAGRGAILDVLLEQDIAHHMIHICEKNPGRREYLAEKYKLQHDVCMIRVVATDFLEYQIASFKSGERMYAYDRIYANPPFENGQDIDHVRHMYDLLRQGGMLVSVMGEHAFFAGDKKSRDFRDWLVEGGGQSFVLPDGTFKESGTGVSARLVFIEKGSQS